MNDAPTDAKIATRDHASHLLQAAREESQVVVMTNGVFDLVHLGHVRYLQRARALGDLLVIGLNSDSSVQRLKGPLRPLIGQLERAVVLSALECVDLVVIFNEETAISLISELKPDIYVKGGDYNPAALAGQRGFLPEAETVRAYGGTVEVLQFLPGHSTTQLIERIIERYS